MNDVIVRRATAEDVSALAELRRRWTFEDEPGTEETRTDFDDAFARVVADGLEKGEWVVWVAEAAGAIVAHAFVAVVRKIPRPVRGFETIGYLTNVYTRPEWRGSGIGGRVLEALTEWAREARVEVLVVWPSEESVAFYERHGFADRGEPLVWRHPEAVD